MAAFVGSSLVLTWTCPGGTVTMNTDFQTFEFTPTIEFYDATAGADTSKSRMPGMKDGTATYKGLMQAGDLPNWGTCFAPGVSGTLVYCPEGTAAGKFAGTVPAYVTGFQQATAYNALVEANVSWILNGDWTKGVK
jgi:hypothetical protein